MTVVTELDQQQPYTVRDQLEVWWRFIYEPTAEMNGWYVWRKEPAVEGWTCIGTIPSKRVLQAINSQPPPLTVDDSIDFHIWLDRFYGTQDKDNTDDPTEEAKAEQEGS